MSEPTEPIVLDFSDTSIAFASKSDADLQRMHWLFGMMNYPALVDAGTFLVKTTLALPFTKPLTRFIVKETLFKQFCGGEDIDDCLPVIEQLAQYGIGTILDYSVEGEKTEEGFERTTAEVLRTIDFAAQHPAVPFAVFKVTGIAPFTLLEKVSSKASLSAEEEKQWVEVQQRVHRLCEAAYHKGVRIFIDAEETWIQAAIDHLAYEMMKRFNRERAVVYNTYQLYRRDGLQLLKEAFAWAQEQGVYLGAKLVRGAYMEKERERAQELGYPDPIQPNKKKCDEDYNAALLFCLERIDRVAFCAGTHNEQSCLLLAQSMQEKDIAPQDERIYFAQLYGMSDHISFNLAKAGYRVAKYLPYGPVDAVVPYLIRRAEENTSIKGQSNREYRLISEEIKRRKKR
jgi:proline dehydrogenase